MLTLKTFVTKFTIYYLIEVYIYTGCRYIFKKPNAPLSKVCVVHSNC